MYCPAFIDAVIHTCLVMVTDTTVYYAGGFECGHFLRTPTTDDVLVHFLPEYGPLQVGRRTKAGSLYAYDGNGLLLFYIQVCTYRLCVCVLNVVASWATD